MSHQLADGIPEAPEAEADVLGAVLYDGSVLNELGHVLTAADFLSARGQAIYTAATDLHVAGKPVTLVSVTDRLREMNQLEKAGGPAYLAQLMEGVFGSGLAMYYAQIVRSRSQQRRALRLVSDAAATLRRSSDKWTTEVDDLQQQLFTLMQARRHPTTRPMAELVPQEYDRLQALWRRRQMGEPVSTGVPTGFPKLDRILGGLHAGELIIIAGRPGQGKTTLQTDLAQRLAGRGQRVLFFSLEMGGQAILMKWIAALSRVPLQRIRQGDFRPGEVLDIGRACDELARLPILVDDDPALRIFDMRARVRQAVNGAGPCVVFVDYLQRMSAVTAPGKSRREEVDEIAAGLKTIAREMSVPVLATAQLSRSVELRGEDAEPRLSDLRESGRIEAEADVVTFLHRTRANDGTVKLLVRKHRMGPEGDVELRWQREIGRFEELS